MRKLIFFISISIFSMSLLNSAIYRSNTLGQIFENVDEIKEDGWYLSKNGSSEALYHDGKLEEERTRSDKEDRTVRSDGSERVVTYSDDGIVKEIIERAGDEESKYTLCFDNGRLKGYDYSENGELIKHVDYISFDNRLISLKGDERAIFASDFYSYSMNGEDVILRESKDSREILERNESGFFVETVNINGEDITREFDDSMHIVSEISSSKEVYYSYLDGALSEKRTISGDSEMIESYENGALASTIYFENGIKNRERKVLQSGNIEDIRYISGKQRYRFLYAPDGIKLIEAEAL